MSEIHALGAELVVVTQSRPEMLALYLRGRSPEFPFVCDPSREVYGRFGLEPGGWLMFFRPRVVLRYLTLILRGWVPHLPMKGEDVRQLGGDFILDRNRKLVFAHRSADPADRPKIGTLLAALSRAASS